MSDMVTITVGQGTKLVVHKAVAPIFKAFCDEVDFRGYDLDGVKDDWGYANRAIRGTNTPSNHSWGLAIDLNATRNPMTTHLVTDMPGWMIDLAEHKYGLFWGGRYHSRPDSMHFEFLGTPAEAEAIKARIAGVAPSPGPTTPTGPAPQHLPVLREGVGMPPQRPNDYVKVAQWIMRNKCNQHGVVDDGRFGPDTTAGVKNVQRFAHLTPDGVIGERTWAFLQLANH